MVSTRRGVGENSPSKTNQEETPAAQGTPPTGRRTRSTAKQVEGRTQQTLKDPRSQLETNEAGLLVNPAFSTRKRCTRSSRLHSPEQSSTPVGSIHEADVSDVESVCSVASNTGPAVTRFSGRRMQTRARYQENEMSEVESCSSVSASKSCRRSTRKKPASFSSDSAQHEVEDVKDDPVQEGKSCSSAVSENQRVTRSQRKTAGTRSSAKHQAEDSEFSDADSCTSSISGRASRRRMRPIPIHTDGLSDSSQSPQTSRRTRATRGKVEASVDVSEPLSCDSEGFESGPSYSLSTRRSSRAQLASRKTVDSDSEAPVSSSCSARSRGTPSSSRAGSGTRRQGAPVSRHSERKRGDVENSGESAEEDSSVNDSRLEITWVADAAERTLLAEDEIQTPEAFVRNTNLDSSETDQKTENKHVANISEDNCHVASSSSVCMEETVSELAVITKDQKEEPSAENQDVDESEMEMMQELVPPSERSQACRTDTATKCEGASEMTEEAKEKQEAADRPLLGEEEDKISTDAHQVVDTSEVQTEAAPSNQQDTEDSESEPQPKDAQCRKVTSLLDSSEEDDDDDDDEVEDWKVSEKKEDRGGEPSSWSKAACSSVDGLFVIDTRPGLDADEQYYREEEEASNKRTEQEEDDEEFVDEEGDDDDDEDTKILLSSRNSHVKELSSRIDPGISMKELGGLYISFDGSKSKPVSSSLQKLKEMKNLNEVMKKSVIGPDFEKKDAVPPYSESKQALKLKRRAEREKSTGDGWFNMKAPEITQELKGDLQVLKMRGSLDHKRFYKKNDRDGFPKYFQMGTVVDTPADFYHSRIPKKQRKRTMVEELLADAEFRLKNKKKYKQIITEKGAQGAGKRKKNKFHRK